MLDLLGYTAIFTLIIFMVSSIAVLASGSPVLRIAAAAVAAAWSGFATGAASLGVVAISYPFPMIGLCLITPLILGALAGAYGPFRASFASVPTPWLIILNTGRIAAILFLALASAGRLAGPFPFFAGWGDIITGVVSIPLALGLTRTGIPGKGLAAAILAWNIFGTADLICAIILGVTSASGSPLQVFHAPPGSEAMQFLPFSLIPTVLVPFYLLIHGVIFARILPILRARG